MRYLKVYLGGQKFYIWPLPLDEEEKRMVRVFIQKNLYPKYHFESHYSFKVADGKSSEFFK